VNTQITNRMSHLIVRPDTSAILLRTKIVGRGERWLRSF